MSDRLTHARMRSARPFSKVGRQVSGMSGPTDGRVRGWSKRGAAKNSNVPGSRKNYHGLTPYVPRPQCRSFSKCSRVSCRPFPTQTYSSRQTGECGNHSERRSQSNGTFIFSSFVLCRWQYIEIFAMELKTKRPICHVAATLFIE